MAVTSKWYGLGVKALLNKEADLDTDTLYCALVNGYTFNQDTHDYWNDASASQVPNGNGYTTNGVLLSGVSLSYDTATNEVRLNASPASWASSSITATGAIIYDRSPGSDATRPLLIYIDFGATESSTNDTFSITFASGIAGKATVS